MRRIVGAIKARDGNAAFEASRVFSQNASIGPRTSEEAESVDARSQAARALELGTGVAPAGGAEIRIIDDCSSEVVLPMSTPTAYVVSLTTGASTCIISTSTYVRK